jgi:hypothetical protein
MMKNEEADIDGDTITEEIYAPLERRVSYGIGGAGNVRM